MISAHAQTDRIIADIEKQISALYNESYRDIAKKSAAIMTKIETTPNMTSAQRYLEWQKYNRFQSLSAQIADTLRDTNSEAVKIVNGYMSDVYKLNYADAQTIFPKDTIFPPLGKSAVASVLSGQVTPFKKLAVDSLLSRADLERELTSALLSGIMQGESIPSLAKRIQGVTDKSLSQSIRIARTETTRVENSAKQDVGEYGKKLGFKMMKQWVATEDARTRPEHTAADGQTVPIDEPFKVGGEYLMYPGDESGSAWNTINCRCTVKNIVQR